MSQCRESFKIIKYLKGKKGDGLFGMHCHETPPHFQGFSYFINVKFSEKFRTLSPIKKKSPNSAVPRLKGVSISSFYHLLPFLQRNDHPFRTSVFLLGYSCIIDKQAVLSTEWLVLRIGLQPSQTQVIFLLNEM